MNLNWLIWSNEHHAWWKANKCGYTKDVATAGRYLFDDAIEICRDARNTEGTPPETMIREDCL